MDNYNNDPSENLKTINLNNIFLSFGITGTVSLVLSVISLCVGSSLISNQSTILVGISLLGLFASFLYIGLPLVIIGFIVYSKFNLKKVNLTINDKKMFALGMTGIGLIFLSGLLFSIPSTLFIAIPALFTGISGGINVIIFISSFYPLSIIPYIIGLIFSIVGFANMIRYLQYNYSYKNKNTVEIDIFSYRLQSKI